MTVPPADRLAPGHLAPDRLAWGPVAAMTVAGWVCVVLGGLVAAITGPLELADGSWIAAYLVLVGGVAQIAMGAARLGGSQDVLTHRWLWVQVGTWNLGSIAVIVGTVAGRPLIVDLGSALLFVAVAIAWHAARPSESPHIPRAVRRGYRILLVVLLVSIPVGMMLSHLRHG